MKRPVEIGVDVSYAASKIAGGHLVAIPTETVYGLAADAMNPLAVAKIFEAKQRPKFDPLIVHIASQESLGLLAEVVPAVIRKLIDRFWPGPLTVVLPKKACVPDLVTSGLETVAVRMPDHPLTLRLIEQTGKPLAAPSANLFGRTSPTTALHVADQLGEQVGYILDGGPCKVGIESTIVAVDEDRLILLRPGGITIEQIEDLVGTGKVIVPDSQADSRDGSGRLPLVPGQLKEHYAPLTPLMVSEKIFRPTGRNRVGLLTFQLAEADRKRAVEMFEYFEELSATGNLPEAAANFFAAIRKLDRQNLDLIVATPFPQQGLGRALNDRLNRAAH